MNPVELRTPNGQLRAFGCGQCSKVHAIEYGEKRARQYAERCCTCHETDCNKLARPNLFCEEHLAIHDAEDRERFAQYKREQAEEEERYASLSPAEQNHANAVAALREEMSIYSEDVSCCGWLTGLEFRVWRAVMFDLPERGWSRWDTRKHMRTTLRRIQALSAKVGGWHIHERFVPMVEWLGMVAEHARANPDYYAAIPAHNTYLDEGESER